MEVPLRAEAIVPPILVVLLAVEETAVRRVVVLQMAFQVPIVLLRVEEVVVVEIS